MVGEFGFSSLLSCEADLEAEEASEVMEMELVSLLLSLTTIMVVMYFSRLLMEMQQLFLN